MSTSEHALDGGAAMGDPAGEGPYPAAPADAFSRDDVAQFDSDDVLAGKAIGKMLAAFFFYTVVAMSLVAWWTFGRS